MRLAKAGSLLLPLLLTSCAADPKHAVVNGAQSDVSVVAISTLSCAVNTSVGSGVMVADGVVLTAAHVVAGARSINIHTTVGSHSTDEIAPGSVVAFDPAADVALLQLARSSPQRRPGEPEDPQEPDELQQLLRGSSQPSEDRSARRWEVEVVRKGNVVRVPVRGVRRVTIKTRDIYLEHQVQRPGWVFESGDGFAVEPGDSGGALVSDGELVGIVWARSTSKSGRGYALRVPEGLSALAYQLQLTGERSTSDRPDPRRCPDG